MNKWLNKQTVTTSIVALLVGVLLTGGLLFLSAPKMMMMEDEGAYGFEETVERFEEEVVAANWKLAGLHDMQEVLAGFGHDVLQVKVYELCSSKYSAVILAEDDERIVSPLMPCRVAIYEKSDGKTYITRMNSRLMAMPFGGMINDVMKQAAGETEVILAKIIKE
ncbi:MAG TPA: hypothetical protein DEA52_06540 [Clostridiaceae bacterium]|nr:hypothetical protein [Clostridiaceae bacterium]